MPEGVFIGGGVEVEGAAEKMVRRVGDEELCGCRRIAAYFKEDAADAVWRLYDGILDGAGLDGMFEGHFIGVVLQLVKGVPLLRVWGKLTLVRLLSYRFVADVDAGAKTRKVDIYPIWVFGDSVEIAAVPDNVGINGIFEGIGKVRAVEALVLMRREVDLKITSPFW